jgi:hypothetical protein
MSYPFALTLHAERTVSLRYGRTTLRREAPPNTPVSNTQCIHRATQRNSRPASAVALGMVGTVPPLTTVPLPRRPPDPDDRQRLWYENELGWRTVPGEPLRLVTGLRFDVLDVPLEAGVAALWRLGPDSPVAVRGDRMRLLVAAGSAEEVPGLLDWLEWGALAPELDLLALGEGGHMEAPPVPGAGPAKMPPLSGAGPAKDHLGQPLPAHRPGPLQGAAVWLRPPEPGCEVEASLPTLSALGSVEGAPDLVRLVDTVATQCHRVRLRRSCAQPLAFS